ncbi:chemotaxis-specific protein-glutamate methyltransferase CheB [Fibrobacterota bacterium]
MSLKALIVDDTVTYRKILSNVIRDLPDVEAIGTAPNGSIALKKMEQNQVDLVLLDIVMPGMDGIETLKRMKDKFTCAEVVMVSGVSEKAAEITIQALKIGALEFVRKPEGGDVQANTRELRTILSPIIRMVLTRLIVRGVIKGTSTRPPETKKPVAREAVPRPAPVPERFDVLAIGTSTGGPHALNEVIPKLPGDFPLPIVLVQHMPPKFTAALARDLNKRSELSVVEASEHLPVKAGTVIIARGGYHMVVAKTGNGPVIRLNEGPPENSCRPSVDVLFRSVADVYGEQGVLSVIMTGMGNDGVSGIKTLKRKACYCITQNKQSCVVYGMPRLVDEAGLSDKSVDLENIAATILGLVSGH